MGRQRKSYRRVILGSLVVLIVIYFTTGLFVVRPISVLSSGSTIWYWRVGVDLPFIASAEGVIEDKNDETSLLGRVADLAAAGPKVIDRKIISFPYSKTLYSISKPDNKRD